MGRPLAPPALLAALALVAGGTAGCGGSGAPSSRAAADTSSRSTGSGGAAVAASSATSTAAVTATGTPTAPGPSGAGSGTSSGSGGAGVSGPPLCRASGLALSFLGGQGATGHGELGFALRNTTAQSCSTGGYPGIQFLDAGGGPLPTTPDHTPSDFFGRLPLASLVVAPGDSVSFRLGVSHGEGSSAGCATASGLQVIPPDDTATLRTTIPNGATECGATTVSPVQPGETAYH